MNKVILNIIFAALAFNFYSCSDPVTGDLQNIPPDTRLTLFPDSIIAPGSTLRKISWWGDDADGFVAGYYFSFDSTLPVSAWTFTEKSDSTFLLQMSGNDTTFRFYVAAIDDRGAIDPSPASNLFPTINSPPSMLFDGGTEIPDTIYPVATFKWSATDPDGNSTVKYFYWSLNDTNHLKRLDGNIEIMTLLADSGLALNSGNCLYMKAQDNAGAYSNTVRMPADTTKYFFVKKVNSKILLIKDMPPADLNTLSGFYHNNMDTIRYDTLDIKSGNGKFIPKIINPMFIETLNLFDIVIWSAGRGNVASDNANFDLAQRSLPYFLQSGGKLFFTTGFPNAEQSQGNLINFAPIDSVAYCTIPLLSNVSLVNINNSYPVLTTSSLVQRTRGLKVPQNVSVLYRLPSTVACSDINGGPIVAIKNSINNPNNIFMGMPLYFLNGNQANAKQFLYKIIVSEFGYN